MSFFRGAASQPTTTTYYSGLQVQSTSSCLPIPIVYGCNLLAPNVVWYNHFHGVSTASKGKGGGKGGIFSGGSSSSQQTQLKYYAAIIMAICEGPIIGIGQVWQGSPTPTSLGALGLYLFPGNQGQAIWSFLSEYYPSQAISYPSTAYVASSNYDLGTSASLGTNNFEVLGFFYRSGCNGVDADPALVLQDFLTNHQYGVGFPAASIDTSALLGSSGDASYQTYCWAAGLAFSPVLSTAEKASSVIARWLQLTNSTAVWSSGKLKIIPYGDYTVIGNGKTWVPNVATLYDLTDDDFMAAGDGDDPLTIIRTDPFSIANRQAIEIQSRADSYNTGPVPTFDQSMIDRFGLRVGGDITAHEICDLNVANAACQFILQRGLYIRNTYTFKLSWEFAHLDPMDLVTITDEALGLNKTAVRIIDIEEDDDGYLSVTAEEFPQGVASAVVYAAQTKSNGAPDSNAAAVSVNPPLIFEPPSTLSGNELQIWAAVSPTGADTNWGGCVVWASLDDTSYVNVATLIGSAAQGVTSAALPAYSGVNPDTADTLSVDLSLSGQAVANSTAAVAAAGVSLAYVGGEFLSYTTATLTAANKYALTGLYRGLEGIASEAIAAGAPFALLANGILKYTVPSSGVGSTVYLKFQSFNILGGGLEDLSDCVAYSYVLKGYGVIGPVSQALALGTNLDYGRASQIISEYDDFGFASNGVIDIIDLGLASA